MTREMEQQKGSKWSKMYSLNLTSLILKPNQSHSLFSSLKILKSLNKKFAFQLVLAQIILDY